MRFHRFTQSTPLRFASGAGARHFDMNINAAEHGTRNPPLVAGHGLVGTGAGFDTIVCVDARIWVHCFNSYPKKSFLSFIWKCFGLENFVEFYLDGIIS